jgi:hypothetical protein
MFTLDAFDNINKSLKQKAPKSQIKQEITKNREKQLF